MARREMYVVEIVAAIREAQEWIRKTEGRDFHSVKELSDRLSSLFGSYGPSPKRVAIVVNDQLGGVVAL